MKAAESASFFAKKFFVGYQLAHFAKKKVESAKTSNDLQIIDKRH